MAGDYQNGSGGANDNDGDGDSTVELYQFFRQIGTLAKWIVLAVAIIVLISLFVFGRSVFTDWLWFDNLGYRGIFVKILTTRITLFLIGAAAMAVLSGISIYTASLLSRGRASLPLPDDLLSFMGRALLSISGGVVLVLAVVFGTLMAARWEIFLRFSHAAPFGQIEPVFGREVGFYVFTLPMLSFLQGWVLGMLILTLIATIAFYFLRFSMQGMKLDLNAPGVKIHLSILAALVMFTIGFGHWIDRWDLLLSEDGAVFGAAYTDVNARMPALLIMTIIAVGAGILMLANTYFSGRRLLIGAFALWFVANIVLGSVWPNLNQQFTVNPNEFVREEQYLVRNIEFTRAAYGLDRVTEEFYPAETAVSTEVIQSNPKTINNIRLWDYRPLTDVYRQIQLIRPYYDFHDADVDRYEIDGELRQVLLSAREVAPEKLDANAQQWTNTRLVYTHGMGIAMSPVTEFTPEGRPEFFAKDIPADGVIPIQSADSQGDPELLVTNPRIYYGENTLEYVIVNTLQEELDYQTESGDLFRTYYDGPGGVQMSSFFRRLAYAWQFADVNILISGQITGDSRLQYRRAIQERIHTVAPFLLLDKDPYIVAAEGGLYWIQDAYTYTDRYPYSDPFRPDLNYLRNSVKVTVDAFTGDLRFYVWDESDSIIRTYKRIFPDLFLPQGDMPESLRAHVRYPQDLFRIQAEKYIRYHMQVPQNFYNNEDLWAVAEEKFGQGDALQQVEPYFVIMKLPGEVKEEFVMLLPYTPNERQNLIGWLAARSDGDSYGNLIAYNFPKDRQIDGPAQIEARIDNDQDISAWFTLRCTTGSECLRGNLLVIPVGQGIIYAEPVYIRAEGVNFPELKRVILATGDKVVMEDSLNEALAVLTGSQSFVTDAEERPSETTPAPSTSGGAVEATVETIQQAIQDVKDNLSGLEEALDRLTESLSNQ